MIQWYETDHGFLVYENTSTGKTVNVWEGDLDAIGDVCDNWHQTKTDACALMSEKNYGYRNLERALGMLRRIQLHIDNGGKAVDEDDYLDLLTAIYDLTAIIQRISSIA